MIVKDRRLFLSYAIPCANTLMERGSITKEGIDELLNAIINERPIEDKDVDIFKVAKAHCTVIAKSLGKDVIDTEVIEEYFLRKHDEVVDERYAQMGDFDPETCRIFSGRVVSINSGFANVDTIRGNGRYRIDFTPKIKTNDYVIVHRDFVVRKSSKKEHDLLARAERNYFNRKKRNIIR